MHIPDILIFWGTFTKLRKATINFIMSVPPSYYEIKICNKPPFEEICNKSREYFVLRVGWGVSLRRPELHSETHLKLHLSVVKRKWHSLKFSFKILSPNYRIAWKLLHSSWVRFLHTEEMEGVYWVLWNYVISLTKDCWNVKQFAYMV